MGLELLTTKAKSFTRESGTMNSLGTITKKFIIPHKKGNFRLEPEFVVLDNAKVRSFILGTEYQRIYGIDICNRTNRNLKFGTDRENKFSFLSLNDSEPNRNNLWSSPRGIEGSTIQHPTNTK
ncbi:hypothetical protein O181_020747 [Austropuccinia psidii MF-1]|uniref:Uncharacterized protein n=1 Tax=Austropuccinia psidii MF-1 TaxID=1389203 RepID=A0A9Q3GVL3_9BASI|nr:hypothetical protein [Austropuccinia psidii MF-1]